MENRLSAYRAELRDELHQILDYWTTVVPDHKGGGFLGKISNDNIPDTAAPKGAVLNARILWSFAAAYNLEGKAGSLEQADRAYDYFIHHFMDNRYGGVFWTVDAAGNPLDTKKQVYAVAFAIYSLAEYLMASGLEAARVHAIAMFRDVIKYSYDQQNGGFFEAFDRKWAPLADLRLSAKDANEKKTMNTHLHVLEAFTNLYRIWQDQELKQHIYLLLGNFTEYIVDADSGHMILFFDEYWNRKSTVVSYGHDIEASWLLLEAAEVTGDEEWIQKIKVWALAMATAALEGLDKDGGLYYELEVEQAHLIREKHWWVQAEAMVGFFNAWQLNADPRFLAASMNGWKFVTQKLLDKQHGEWFWGISKDGTVMSNEDKAGLWKCPYHNSRACIELIKRISAERQE
jgi:mannobiose 2-epimerase